MGIRNIRGLAVKDGKNERDNSHELYNVGHMYEAAVAHYLATGKRSFLDIAIKSADLLCNTFGPEEEKDYCSARASGSGDWAGKTL